jgi:hypothetical protein
MANRRGLEVLVALVLGLAVAPTAEANWSGLPACGGAPVPPCVVSVERNGSAVGPADPSFAFASNAWSDPDGTDHLNFWVSDGTSTLTTSETWEIVLNTGSVFPEETFARGKNVTITRSVTGAGHHRVHFKLDPVRMAAGGCNSAGACVPVNPDPTRLAYLDGWVDDLAFLADPLDRAAMRGFDLASNTDWVSSPLQLDFATNSIILDVANSHFENDGTTVFVGRAEFRLPNAMLMRLYNVDDPSTLTPAAFVVSGMGTAASSTVTVAPGSVDVVISGMTFSKRKLKIRGRTNPLAPRRLRATRTARTRGVIRSTGSLRRGSKVRGYRAICRNGRGHAVRKETTASRRLPIRIRGLKPGNRYVCTVRAKSRAGLGLPGRVTMRRYPT